MFMLQKQTNTQANKPTKKKSVVPKNKGLNQHTYTVHDHQDGQTCHQVHYKWPIQGCMFENIPLVTQK